MLNCNFSKGDKIDQPLNLIVTSTENTNSYKKVRTPSWVLYIPSKVTPVNGVYKVIIRCSCSNTYIDNVDLQSFFYYEEKANAIFFGVNRGQPYEYEVKNFKQGVMSMLNLLNIQNNNSLKFEFHTSGHSGGDVAAVRLAAAFNAKTCLVTDTEGQSNDIGNLKPTAEELKTLANNRTAICIMKSATSSPANATQSRFERTLEAAKCVVLDIRSNNVKGHNDLQTYLLKTNIPLVIIGQDTILKYNNAYQAFFTKFQKVNAQYAEIKISLEEFIKYCNNNKIIITPTVQQVCICEKCPSYPCERWK